ncbi:MAG: hypothetical protein NTY19_02095, partial [Planctomycetota bacterium]|nr:hypothetical protein [Planctomycetota bacterium]
VASAQSWLDLRSLGHIDRSVETQVRSADGRPRGVPTRISAARSGHIHLSNVGPKKPTGRDIILMTTRRVVHAAFIHDGTTTWATSAVPLQLIASIFSRLSEAAFH